MASSSPAVPPWARKPSRFPLTSLTGLGVSRLPFAKSLPPYTAGPTDRGPTACGGPYWYGPTGETGLAVLCRLCLAPKDDREAERDYREFFLCLVVARSHAAESPGSGRVQILLQMS